MMKMMVFFLISITLAAKGQQINQVLAGTDINGATIRIDSKVSSGVVIFFTSVRCPYDDHYLSRMNDLQSRFGRSFRFYFVNSSPEDTPSSIMTELRDRNSPISYLIDHSQVIKKALGASKTTEVFILRPEFGGFSLFFKGPVDDNPQMAADADKSYLKDALEAYLAGKSATSPGARVAGCLIREP